MASPASHASTARAFAPTDLFDTAAYLVASVHAQLSTKSGSGSDYTDAESYLAQAETADFRMKERLALRAQTSAFLAS